MATVAKLTSIGILVVSFLLAILLYYLISSKSKEHKKKVIERVISQLINLVIYVWIAKILLNITVFIRDPLAVLAYPSDSQAFYLAIGLFLIHLVYQGKKDLQQVKLFSEAIVPIFLSASFFYEFFQAVTEEINFGSFYLGLLFVLLIALIIGFEKWPKHLHDLSLMIAWSIGTLILAVSLPYITIFGYLVSPLFLGVWLVILIGLLIYNQRKVVR